MKKNRVYTRSGDKGKTSLIGGTRVPKNSVRVEAYGTIDELKSFSGHLHDLMNEGREKEFLRKILNDLFIVETLLAADISTFAESNLPNFETTYAENLEKEIDRMNEQLPELQFFILPAGHPIVSMSHICRTICRRAERRALDISNNLKNKENIHRYLNRLSDYYFVLSRFLAKQNDVEDVKWINP